MSKICVKCEKSVYPLEELKCLDKIWHKLCFRCAECGMLLNMKNYKGYNKQPYCVAHYPKTTHTSVAETPEMARVAQNTKQQSLVKYHEEFEKKIKGSKIEVADDQETQRVMKVNALVSQLEYKGKKGSAAPPPANKPQITQKPIVENSSNGDKFSPFTSRNITNSTVYTSDGGKALRSSMIGGRIGSIADYDPMNENYGSLTHGYKPASRQSSVVQADDDDDDGFDTEVKKRSDDDDNKHEVETSKDETNENDQQVEHDVTPQQQQPHKDEPIATNGGNDEEEGGGPSTPKAVSPEIIQTADSLSTLVLESVEKDLHENRIVVDARREEENDNGKFGGVDGNGEADVVRLQEVEHVQPAVTEVIGVDDGEGGEIITTPLPGEFIGLYDYEAQDTDEVTFSEDDVIVEVEKIDDGWLLGTVARTGQRGMLPANYVQKKK